jgi:hypothetical protein
MRGTCTKILAVWAKCEIQVFEKHHVQRLDRSLIVAAH